MPGNSIDATLPPSEARHDGVPAVQSNARHQNAHAEERGVSETDLTREASQEIPALREGDIEEEHHDLA